MDLEVALFQKPQIEPTQTMCAMWIDVRCGGVRYHLRADEDGKLEVQAFDAAISIEPVSANSIKIVKEHTI